ncbi:cytochrome P450 [Epithele typhae]|uniref:cytochrome P450 n=1 Tax=Epithele typhae TaxID=378194 RepID=UPI0020084065|nr:cytochrome P450 [Epithele typhae]KAH9929054.1 cytochrome P450 [Epithele typhae]
MDGEKNGSVDLGEEEDIIQNIGAVAFEGGADTSFSTILGILTALALNPGVVAKAHAELDAVVGASRFPDFSDRVALVYVSAIVLEGLRWHNVAPLGAPHYTMTDDELDGLFIPAGTIVIANTWACLHDPEAYPDPEQFRPERFISDGQLDKSVRDPTAFAFGYGRRICPGRHFAVDSIFINIASILHVFDVTPPVDDNGRPVNVVYEATEGIISYPVDSRCTIKPRSAQAERLIRSQNTKAEV